MHKIVQSMIFLLILLLVQSLALSRAGADSIRVLPAEQDEATQVDFAVPTQVESVPRPKIPEYPVHVYIKNGQQSRFELFFLDVKYDYDLVDFETYTAWCLQKNKKIRRNAMHEVRLYNCYGDNVPEQFKNTDWNRINYIINHKSGSKSAIQDAIWSLSDRSDRPLSEESARILEEASQKGKDFRPSEGELLAIICYPEGKQPVFIEYLIPKSETFDVAPAFFAPPLAVAAAMPNLLPLAPLLAVPVVPFIPNSPPVNPPTPPSVPEPAALLLLAIAFVCIMALRTIPVLRRR